MSLGPWGIRGFASCFKEVRKDGKRRPEGEASPLITRPCYLMASLAKPQSVFTELSHHGDGSRTESLDHDKCLTCVLSL